MAIYVLCFIHTKFSISNQKHKSLFNGETHASRGQKYFYSNILMYRGLYIRNCASHFSNMQMIDLLQFNGMWRRFHDFMLITPIYAINTVDTMQTIQNVCLHAPYTSHVKWFSERKKKFRTAWLTSIVKSKWANPC